MNLSSLQALDYRIINCDMKMLDFSTRSLVQGLLTVIRLSSSTLHLLLKMCYLLITVDKTLLLGGAALALLPTPSTRQSRVWLKFPKPQLKKEPPPMKGLMERQESHWFHFTNEETEAGYWVMGWPQPGMFQTGIQASCILVQGKRWRWNEGVAEIYMPGVLQ